MQVTTHSRMAPAPSDDNTNLRHYWHVILERRWLVVTAFISVFVLCMFYLVKAPRIYQATVRVQIDKEADNLLNLRDFIAVDSREQDYLQTQYKNIKNRLLLQEVVAKLKLKDDPRYAKRMDVAAALDQDVVVAPIRMSRLVDIRVSHTDPARAELIANTLAAQFISGNLDRKKKASSDAEEWLKTEATSQKRKVEEAEAALQAYKERLNNVSLEERENIVLQGLKLAQEVFVQSQTKSKMAARLDEEMRAMVKSGTPIESIPLVANDPLIQQLKAKLAIQESELANMLKRYKDKYPTVVQMREGIESLRKSLREQAAIIVDSTSKAATLAKAEESSLKKYVDELEQKQLDMGKQRIAYDALSREAQIQTQLFMDVIKSQKQMEIAANSKINNMIVVDPAVTPLNPIKPRVALTLVLGVFCGLAAACGLAFFVNYMDDSIKTQEDVETYLRTPFLGYVSNIKSNSVIERDLQAHLHPQSTSAEGFRTIRAAIALMPKADSYRVLAVTSTIPSEGKSLLVSNLAIVTAQTGLKTLLVDADLRRPSVHKAFQLHSPVGLSGYLDGSVARIENIIHTTEVPNLDVVCAGAIPSNPSELSGSKRMQQFLNDAMSRYDRVFLDCPPVSAVSDPLILAAMSDGVVFVTKFNKIRREHARRSIQRIQDAGIRILGVALNDIDFEGRDSTYYSYYYYQNRYYASHYKNEVASEKGNDKPAAKA
jgi:capsular exopolysaccharide synthesis family protein